MQLDFPTIVDYDLAFGTNVFYLLYSDEAVYTFEDSSSSNMFTFYTITVVTSSYGFSDIRKPEFEISVTTQINSTNASSFNTLQSIV